MTQRSRTARPFTGKHITLILVSFFGVVIAVNVLMARLANSTFGGVVVENSYVASQQFNGWLKEANAEQALGWKAEIARDAQGRAAITLRDSRGSAIAAAKVTAVAEHPLGQRPETDLILLENTPGIYTAPLAAGRWRLRIMVDSGGKVWRSAGEVQ